MMWNCVAVAAERSMKSSFKKQFLLVEPHLNCFIISLWAPVRFLMSRPFQNACDGVNEGIHTTALERRSRSSASYLIICSNIRIRHAAVFNLKCSTFIHTFIQSLRLKFESRTNFIFPLMLVQYLGEVPAAGAFL